MTEASTSHRMAAVRNEGTAPELILRRALSRGGFRGYRLNVKWLPGTPDVAFTRWRVAVFVDGAFWHGHPSKFPEAKVTQYWRDKIARNRTRDRRVARQLRRLGWSVVRIWDFRIDANVDAVVRRVSHALALARSTAEHAL